MPTLKTISVVDEKGKTFACLPLVFDDGYAYDQFFRSVSRHGYRLPTTQCKAWQATRHLHERAASIYSVALAREARRVGMWIATVHPAPGFEFNCMRPPRLSARCRMPGIPLPPVHPAGFSDGFNPLPLSSTVSAISRSTTFSSTLTAVQPE